MRASHSKSFKGKSPELNPQNTLPGDDNHSQISGKDRRVMKRNASDNKYLHKDFHISQNILMDYICRNYGKASLIKYLEQFAEAYYKPLKDKMMKGDIEALYKYFKDIYEKEEWPVRIICDKNQIKIEQDACPGISYIKSKGWDPVSDYQETYRTIYRTLCKNTPFEYILQNFNVGTGACTQIFIIKGDKT